MIYQVSMSDLCYNELSAQGGNGLSTHKILALIGAVLTSIGLGLSALLFLLSSVFAVTDSSDPSLAGNIAAAIFLVVLGLVLLAIVISCWIGFVRLDGPSDQGWRIYFLVLGIMTCLSLVGLPPGVLFILAFALNRKQPISEQDQRLVDEEDDLSF